MTLALDTSAAIPLLMASHVAHRQVRRQLRGRDLVLTQHSLAETYSVLTRLPGDARVAPLDAVRLIGASFGPAALLPDEVAAEVPAPVPLTVPWAVVPGAVLPDAARCLAMASFWLARKCPGNSSSALVKPGTDAA